MTVSGLASSRPVYLRILGQCDVRLWGLSSEKRLQKQLSMLGSVQSLATGDALPADASLLLVRADWLYDSRSLRDLLTTRNVVLQVAQNGGPRSVAAHVEVARSAEVEALIAAEGNGPVPAGVEIKTPDTLSSAYVQKLLKTDPPLVAKIRPQKRAVLERHLFDGSYKGVTDLVTKWVWPAPARAVVRFCVALGIQPNGVTLTSLVLVLAVLWLFAQTYFGLGLVLAWIMTFLDTVDGKLARVTLESSPLGHALDKGIDLIHPPLWYIAWGAGALGATLTEIPSTLIVASVVILAGYILGRLLEGAFDFYLGKFPIYSWRPLDSYVRLIIARRNPNLLLLTAAWLAGRPAAGLTAVAVWTSLSTLFLAFRVAYAAYERSGGPLKSWLQEAHTGATRGTLAARTFAAPAASLSQALESSG